MNNLTRYLEEINVAGISLGREFQAYRMDGTEVNRQMRIDAGLGTCICCDYFLLDNDSIVLIEETQLIETIINLKKKFSCLKKLDQDWIIEKLVKKENQVKVYGSMLVLCRLASKCNNLANLFQNKSYKFWLVTSGTDTTESYRYYDNMTKSILSDLRSQLSRELVDDVKIVPSKDLPNILSNL